MKKHIAEPIKCRHLVKAVENYLAVKSKRNQLIWAFGVNTGLRISDILSLNIEDVKDKEYLEIKEKKTGKYKKITLNVKLKMLIKDYLSERNKNYSITKDNPLFVGKKHCRLDQSQVYRFLNEACKELKIPVNVGTHTMRKTFGYFFYQKYNDVALLQKILNHSSPSITMIYIGISQEELDKSYKHFVL